MKTLFSLVITLCQVTHEARHKLGTMLNKVRCKEHSFICQATTRLGMKSVATLALARLCVRSIALFARPQFHLPGWVR